MAVREKRKLPQRTPEPLAGDRITARRPRILIVGGEAKNFKGAAFGERFDCEVHMKTDGNSVHVTEDRFDAVVGLPWITPTLSRNAKAYAKARGIPMIESPKVGQIEHWLGKQLKWAQAYFESLDKVKAAPAAPPASTPEAILASAAPEEPPSAVLWDEDQLWSAYGEPFVQQLKGLDGETTDRKTFVELMESETGLRGEPVEILIAILRRQGIISEDGGAVSIGSVNPTDVEKRKRFIERQSRAGRQPFNNGSRSLRDEVREAFAEGEEAPSGGNRTYYPGITDDDLVNAYKRLEPGRVFIQNGDLFQALTDAGLTKNGKPFSPSAMRMYLVRLERTRKIVRVRTGIGHSFMITIPGFEPPAAVAPETVSPPRVVPNPHVEVKMVNGEKILVDKPFAAAFPPAAVEQAPELPFPVPTEEKDISKEGVLYSMLEKTYSPARLPELGALVSAVRAFRGLFYETAWDTAAIRGILVRLKIPLSDPNQKRAQTRKLDFTDDEWSYFALEYLRDQTLFAMLPLIDDTNRLWRICEGCDKHFYFNVPRICYECRDGNRRVVESAKGG